MDLTVVAAPFYFGSMGAEHWKLKRRARRNGPSPVDYERSDTIASLTMGTVSLVLPLVTRALTHRIAPQRSTFGKGLVAAAAVRHIIAFTMAATSSTSTGTTAAS